METLRLFQGNVCVIGARIQLVYGVGQYLYLSNGYVEAMQY